MFKIETGVPIPSVVKNHKYPFADMKVGDSFAEPVPEGEKVYLVENRLRAGAKIWGLKLGFEFKVVAVDDKKAVRVWRVA
jgi:hypothetical protein